MPKIEYERIGEYTRTALLILAENDGVLRSREVLQEVGKRLEFTEYEAERYEKSGYIRWESILHFYSISCVKAGWVIKNKGFWYLTEEGRKVINFSNLDFFNLSEEKYREWSSNQPDKESVSEPDSEDNGEAEFNPLVTIEMAQSSAQEGLVNFVSTREAYEFQDMVAALLRSMGYHTPFIAPRGPDGGVDIIAYRDPLGTTAPRISVQVKQRSDTKASVQEVRELSGLLGRDGDTGLFVSTGGFTKDALNAAKNSSNHIEAIDLGRFIDLWTTFYPDMKEEDRLFMPLTEITFYSPPN